MIKSHALRNNLMYQSMPAGDLSTFIDGNREYLGAVFDIRDTARWLQKLLSNPLFGRYALNCPAIAGLVANHKDTVDGILLAEDNYDAYLTKCSASPAAVTGIAGTYLYSQITNTSKYKTCYNPGSEASVIKTLALMLNMPTLPASHTSMAAVAADQDVMTAIAVNKQAVTTIATSQPAMQAMTGSASAMAVLAASQTAMEILASVAESRQAIIASAVAMTAIAANEYATAQIITRPSINDVIAVSGNITILATHAAAMRTISANSGAFGVLYGDSATRAILLGSPVAIDAMLGSGASAQIVTASGVLPAFIIDDARLALLVASGTAMSALGAQNGSIAIMFSSVRTKLALYNSAIALDSLRNYSENVRTTLWPTIQITNTSSSGAESNIYPGKALIITHSYSQNSASSTVTYRFNGGSKDYLVDNKTYVPVMCAGENTYAKTLSSGYFSTIYWYKMDA